MAGELLDDVDEFAALLRRGKSTTVRVGPTKGTAVLLTTRYFGQRRPELVAALGETAQLLELDTAWQHLLRIAHENQRSRASYEKALQEVRQRLMEVTLAALTKTASANKPDLLVLSQEETRLLQTLERAVPPAAESYKQGMADLAQKSRASYRGTATEFRECLREVVDHLAPDQTVMAEQGFKLEPNQTRPTTKQKVGFVLRSRRRNDTQREATTRSLDLIDEMSGALTRAIQNRASVATHVPQTAQEVRQIKRYVDVVLFDLLEIT
ncbi:MAG: hypothetical protein WB439_13775 [Acidobacteriaceae bacterium]